MNPEVAVSIVLPDWFDFPKNKKLTHAFSVFEPFLPESHAVIDMLTEYLRKF